jgi:quercetin dioxygenase-like cupin family protein
MKPYFLIFILAISAWYATAQTNSPRIKQEEGKYSLENCLNRFDRAKSVETTVGYQYWFIPQKFLADGLTVKMSVTGPNQATHAPHHHAGDEIFFVLEGTARFHLNGQTATGTAYSSFYCPEGSEHGISNAGNDTLKYLVIRKYPMN